MSTFSTTAVPYASAADFVDRYDVNLVAQLLSDNKQSYLPSDVSTPGTPAYVRLFNLLLAASGWLESACMRGERYTVKDLQGVQANGGASAAMLADIVGGLTMFRLWERRSTRHKDMELPPSAEIAFQQLDRLDKGERILGIVEAALAGQSSTPQFMNHGDYQRRAFSASQAGRYFGNRANQFVPGGQGGTDSCR